MKNKSISPRNEEDKRHGYWKIYCYNNELWFKCFYKDGEEVGYEEHNEIFSSVLSRKTFHI